MRIGTVVSKLATTGKSFTRTLFILGCCAVSIGLTGCALTRTETPVVFVSKVNEPLKPERKNSLIVGEIKDTRPVNDAHVLIHKQNEYGTTSGAYATKQTVAEIFKKGLTDTLRNNGFIDTDPGKYELRADLQEFTFEGIGGFWHETVKPKLVVRFELIEKASGTPVWHDTFIGHTTGKTAWGTKEFVGQMFSQSADDLVKQLIEDKTFRGFFE